MDRGWREMPPNCPRCGSTNTKFCYYNNYSLTQPRYFCKGCRRYWTKGGSLRSVPVGGGCRKSRRGNKPALRAASAPTTTPYPNATSPSCRRAMSAFGHVIMSSDGPSSSSSSSASTIDLSAVYANFLNPKTPQERDENHPTRLPHNHTYHDHLIIAPIDHIPSNICEANMDLGVADCVDLALSTGLSDQTYLGEEGDHFLLLQHHHHHHKNQDQGLVQNPTSSCYNHDHVSNGNERINVFGALLPPLPGEEEANEVAIPWEKITNPDDHLIPSPTDHIVASNVLESTMQDPLEGEAQLSSFFNIDGCWSPLDFSGYPDIQTPVAATTTTAPSGAVRQQQWP